MPVLVLTLLGLRFSVEMVITHEVDLVWKRGLFASLLLDVSLKHSQVHQFTTSSDVCQRKRQLVSRLSITGVGFLGNTPQILVQSVLLDARPVLFVRAAVVLYCI